MELLIFVLFAVVAVGAAVWWVQQKAKRREDLAAFAFRHGMEYSATDAHDLTDLDFKLFKKGDGRGCENVLTGRWNTVPVTEADYWYYDESTDSEGKRSRTYHRFSVVVTEFDALVPSVVVEQENLLTRLADHLGFRDIEFESEEFNRRFQVRTPDRQFAFKLLDARMLTWLLATKGYGFEVNGNRLLVWTGRLAPQRLAPLFEVTRVFLGQVPRLVWAEYGTGTTTSP